jgi:UDP-N-acetyl-2-amino-2-deoxyglucuronate dehydrogenase
MNPTSFRTALIGCGKVAATHAYAWNDLPASQFVAVCDRDLQRAGALAARFSVRPYTNLTEMLERERVQVLSICTQHVSHSESIETAAKAGVHVIVEKPLTADLDSCSRALRAAQVANIQVGVISQRRFYEPVQRMKQAIDAGKIGHPVLAEVVMMGWRSAEYYRSDPWRGTWKGEGGGVVVSQAPHYLDLLCWFMGPVRELHAYWDNFNHPSIEVDDTVVAAVRFKSGAIGSIILSNSQKPGLYGRIHVHGSSGASIGAETDTGSPFISGVSAKADPPVNDLWTIPGEEHLLSQWIEEDRARDVDVMNHYHRLQLEEFLCAVREGRPPAVDGEAGRQVVELFTAVYRSQREGRPVAFPVLA